jgi:ketosteroid isomerase-like protein
MSRLQGFACGVLVAVGLPLMGCTAQAPPNDSEVIAVVESFYAAIKKGDTAAAMSVIAPDAVFLESGRLETRAEYEAMRVTFDGNTAWVIATTEYDGTFDGSPVSFVSAQLVVLTRDAGTWQIRTIHWSSRRT